jgi:hypothetical protein
MVNSDNMSVKVAVKFLICLSHVLIRKDKIGFKEIGHM